MPTVIPEGYRGPYRFFFYAHDRLNEPPHMHVERDTRVAKVWLDPVRLQHADGFRRAELREVVRLVEQYEKNFLEAWYAFGS